MNRTDNFTRPDNPTSLGTPSDAGSAWVPQVGTWGILSNNGYNPPSDPVAFATLASATTDVVATITQSVVGTNTGAIARYATGQNCYIASYSGGTISLGKFVAGAYSNLGNHTQTLSAGDTLAVSCNGSTIEALYNGTSVITATDTTHTTGTDHGIFAGSSSGARFDAFTIVDGSPPPPTGNRGLIDQAFTYWEYRAASGGDLSRLTLWMMPRNVLLYDAQADAALTWLQANTPAALQF